MDPDEILQAADAARPDLIEKVAMAVALLEQFSPEYAVETQQEMNTILSYTQEKTAAADWTGFGMAVGGTLAAGLAGAVAIDLYDAAKKGLTKGRNFKRIMDANPELKVYENKRLRSSFDTIHRYVPEFTADPMMGGSLLKAVTEAPGNEVALIKDMLGARKNLIESKAKQFSPAHAELKRFEDRHGDAVKIEAIRHRNTHETERLKNILRHESTMELEALKLRGD